MKFTLTTILAILFSCGMIYAQQRPAPDKIPAERGGITIQPIYHATLVLSWNGYTIYVDPVGGAERFKGLAAPDLILITHAHSDHFSPETLDALDTENSTLVVPQSVADKLPKKYADKEVVMNNGDHTEQMGISIRAIPMYNLPESKDSYHPKGWGNGYVLTLGGKRIYISGDTEDIPEMRLLKNIDIAFVCMNLPYTMNVEQAASAVLAFKPHIVYPYHYRGQDTQKFKELVEAGDKNIEVRLRNWYMGN